MLTIQDLRMRKEISTFEIALPGAMTEMSFFGLSPNNLKSFTSLLKWY